MKPRTRRPTTLRCRAICRSDSGSDYVCDEPKGHDGDHVDHDHPYSWERGVTALQQGVPVRPTAGCANPTADTGNTGEATRYFIGHDDSGHHYVVPVANRDEWVKWVESIDDDTVNVPEYANRIDGKLTFTNWRTE